MPLTFPKKIPALIVFFSFLGALATLFIGVYMGLLSLDKPFIDYTTQELTNSGENLNLLKSLNHGLTLSGISSIVALSALALFHKVNFSSSLVKSQYVLGCLSIILFLFLTFKSHINTPIAPYQGYSFTENLGAYLPLTWLKIFATYLLSFLTLSYCLTDLARQERSRAKITKTTNFIDCFNYKIGTSVAWVALLMILLQAFIVVLRYIFSLNFIFLQEGMVYLHSILFLVAASYTLLIGGHVRVDVFYRESSPTSKARTDLAGCLLFLFPFCAIVWAYSFGYVSLSWSTLEGSPEKDGLQIRYLLKSLILVFTFLIGFQGVGLALRSICTLAGHPLPDFKAKETKTTEPLIEGGQ